jgi:hypothetical protein
MTRLSTSNPTPPPTAIATITDDFNPGCSPGDVSCGLLGGGPDRLADLLVADQGGDADLTGLRADVDRGITEGAGGRVDTGVWVAVGDLTDVRTIRVFEAGFVNVRRGVAVANGDLTTVPVAAGENVALGSGCGPGGTSSTH